MSESELSRRIDEMEKRILFLELEVRKLSKQFRELSDAGVRLRGERMTDEQDSPQDDSASLFFCELKAIINCHSKENGSDSPDYVLANYLCSCLRAFDDATNSREKHYGRETTQTATTADRKRCRWVLVKSSKEYYSTGCGEEFFVPNGKIQDDTCPECGGELVTDEK